MQRFRDEERAHEEWLEECIRERQRHREEQQHLRPVRSVVERYALRQLQDEPAPVTYL